MNLSLFVESLSELMLEAKLNAPALAKELGCERGTINRYLTGKKIPSVDMVIRMAEYFNCSVAYLLGLETEKYFHAFKPCPAFKDHLPILCKQLNTTKAEIRRKTGIAESAIYTWQSGIGSPNIESIVKIAEVYNCSVDFVLGRSNL